MAEPSKERIAAALALAEAVCALATAVDGDGAVPPELLQARQDALRAYRATAPKLRTRAEVDAEIVAIVRACPSTGGPDREPCLIFGESLRRVLFGLREEPTQDSGPSSADGAEVSSPRPPASPAGADLFECPFCRCTQGRHVIWCQYPRGVDVSPPHGERPRCIRSDAEAHATGDTRYCRECLSKPCRWWNGWRPSGPPGAAAAKESSDTTAAAPEGAALHDVTGDMPRWQCTRNGCGHWNRSIHRRCIRCGELNLDGEPPESHACNPPPLRDPDCNCEQALELQKLQNYVRRSLEDLVTLLDQAREGQFR